MNRSELVQALATKSGLSQKDASSFLNNFIDTVTEELQGGGSIDITGFGSFKVADRAAREARNPRTGETIQVPARRVPTFKAGKNLKAAL